MAQEVKLQRRVVGYHDLRTDGLTDLLQRAQGMTVLDVGCNRGLVGFEFANNGARVVHGCDNYEPGIVFARELFVDMPSVQAQFEVVDLTGGPASLKAFGTAPYDIVLLLAVVHKIARIMSPEDLSALVRHFGERTLKYLAWRGTANDPVANEVAEKTLSEDLSTVGLKRIHYSAISPLGPAVIWARG